MKKLIQTLTKNNTEIPLFYTTFNLNKYKEGGIKGSCDLKIHPVLRDDKEVINRMNELVDYIRDNYNMDELI